MKATFKIGKTTYTFGDLTLKKYYELKRILETEAKDKEFQIVEIMTNCPMKELKKLAFTDWLIVWAETEHQLTSMHGDTEFIRPVVELKGIKYALPAIEDITIGEFADLDIIISGNNSEAKMAEIAAVLYRPIKSQKGETLILEDYNTDGFKERVELFQDMPISAIKSANSFFLQSANLYLRNTADSLLNLEETKLMSQKDLDNLRDLLQQGPGGELSIPWLGKILSDFKMLRSSQYAQHLTGLPGKKTKQKNWLSKLRDKITTK
jgi:hypothetical protein